MSAVYYALLMMTLLGWSVASESGTIINVYSRGSQDFSDNAPKFGSTSAVIFSVGRKGGFAPNSTSRIPMDHEFYNKGGYFEKKTRLFRAPLSGVYAFYFGASSESGKRVHLILKVGNPEKAIASTYNYNTAHGHASGFVIVELKIGDQASLWIAGGTTINSQTKPSTYFSGFLVTAVEDAITTSKQC